MYTVTLEVKPEFVTRQGVCLTETVVKQSNTKAVARKIYGDWLSTHGCDHIVRLRNRMGELIQASN